MRSRLFPFSALSVAVLICTVPLQAVAQPDDGGNDGAGSDSAKSSSSDKDGEARTKKKLARPGVHISPYIEAAQVATAEISPGNDVLTFTRLAAGVDASVVGRSNGASASVRYERYIGWGGGAADGDVISGVARGYATVTPGLQIEGGALAARTKVDGSGSSNFGGFGNDSARVYSIYAGPTLAKQFGDVKFDANYRFGYNRVEEDGRAVVAPGVARFDVFDESRVHEANVRAGVRPGAWLPVGIGVGAGYYREDVTNLDQRVENFHARADFTLPVSLDLALVAGIGYEDVEISARDAVRGAFGLPVIGPNGRFVTDDSAPRQIAYETEGLIWDAGVLWRPSRRTSLEAHVGKRYGSTTYYGSFAYAPNERSTINVSVYDNVAGFGGQVTRALAGLPTQFEVTRDPLTGEITGCVSSQQPGGLCLVDVLGSIRSSVFRARGIAASYNLQLGRISAGLGVGFDRRKFFGAPGTILAASNGVIDKNLWVTGFVTTRINERGSLTGDIYANWFDAGSTFGGKSSSMGATVAYGHTLTDHLVATAALGIDGVMRPAPFADFWEASALLGVKYRF